MMKTYINKLRAEADQATLQHAPQLSKSRESESYKPLPQQIEALMRSLPQVQRDRH